MRSVNLLWFIVLASCGDASATMTVVSPDELAYSRVFVRSAVVTLTNPRGELPSSRTRLLSSETYKPLAVVSGEPVWAGRRSWQESIVGVKGADTKHLTLSRVDHSDELVLVPPGEQGWGVAFTECGETLCTVTWENATEPQKVDVVATATLTKVAAFTRPTKAWAGSVDASRAVSYHVDAGMRVVAEDQMTGTLLWHSPLDAPTAKGTFELEDVQVLLTGTNRYVLVLYGLRSSGYGYAELSVYDSGTGNRRNVDAKRFTELALLARDIAIVPGSDSIVIVKTRRRSGGESPVDGLERIAEVSIPGLAPIASFAPRDDERWAFWAPGQIVPLRTRQVLVGQSLGQWP